MKGNMVKHHIGDTAGDVTEDENEIDELMEEDDDEAEELDDTDDPEWDLKGDDNEGKGSHTSATAKAETPINCSDKKSSVDSSSKSYNKSSAKNDENRKRKSSSSSPFNSKNTKNC